MAVPLGALDSGRGSRPALGRLVSRVQARDAWRRSRDARGAHQEGRAGLAQADHAAGGVQVALHALRHQAHGLLEARPAVPHAWGGPPPPPPGVTAQTLLGPWAKSLAQAHALPRWLNGATRRHACAHHTDQTGLDERNCAPCCSARHVQRPGGSEHRPAARMPPGVQCRVQLYRIGHPAAAHPAAAQQSLRHPRRPARAGPAGPCARGGSAAAHAPRPASHSAARPRGASACSLPRARSAFQ